ncbi:MAG: PilN domain-containing protein [Oligoflexia bacterium]|nr:PilN domain-containing protein [Oligoflexia bacterium]
MIKINLLGDETVIDQSGKLFLLGYGASLIVLILVFLVAQTSVAGRVSELREKEETLNAKLVQLKKTTQEVRELEKKKQELDLITATIAKLKLSQAGPVRVLDDLNLAVPSRLWLSEISEKSGIMQIKGLAITDQEIVGFMKNLEASNYFTQIDLKESVSVSLVKVSAYNHFTSKFTRYTVRAEERMAQMRRIQEDAKRAGLKFGTTEGPPITSASSGDTVKVMSTQKIGGFRGLVESGVFRKGSNRVERISAWSSVEPVAAKAFIVTARVLYTGKLKALLDAQAKPKNEAGDDKTKDKNVSLDLLLRRLGYALVDVKEVA